MRWVRGWRRRVRFGGRSRLLLFAFPLLLDLLLLGLCVVLGRRRRRGALPILILRCAQQHESEERRDRKASAKDGLGIACRFEGTARTSPMLRLASAAALSSSSVNSSGMNLRIGACISHRWREGGAAQGFTTSSQKTRTQKGASPTRVRGRPRASSSSSWKRLGIGAFLAGALRMSPTLGTVSPPDAAASFPAGARRSKLASVAISQARN